MLIAKWRNNSGEISGCVSGENSEDMRRVIVANLCCGEAWETFGKEGDCIIIEEDTNQGET